MPAFVPVHPPRNPEECPSWLHEAIKRLNRQATVVSQGQAAVLRGEAPDGSGTPLLDLTKYFYKPGISGGQIAYGGLLASENLTLSATAAASKGKILLGTVGAFDETNQRFGVGTQAPTASVHVKQKNTGGAAYSRPTTPVTGSWGLVGTNAAVATADVVADEDTTYIQSGDGSDFDEIVTLAEFTSLASLPDDQFVVNVRVRKIAGSGYTNGIEVNIYSGLATSLGSLLVSFTIPPTSLSTSYTTYQYAMSGAQGALFKTTNQHSVRFRAGAGNSPGSDYNLTQFFIQAPGGSSSDNAYEYDNSSATLMFSVDNGGAILCTGFTVRDSADTTKKMTFVVSSVTTATTRSLTVPDLSGIIALTTGAQTLSSKTLDNTCTVTLKDTLFTLQDDGDTTKQLKFQLSGITTATTRTLTAPDLTGTIMILESAQTVSGLKTFSGNPLFKAGSSTAALTIQKQSAGSTQKLLSFVNASATATSYFDSSAGLVLDSASTGVSSPAYAVIDTITMFASSIIASFPNAAPINITFSDALPDAHVVMCDTSSPIDLTAQTGNIGTTSIFTSARDGLYRVSIYHLCSTAGVAGVLTTTLSWNDGVAARSVTPAANIVLTSTANFAYGEALVWLPSSQSISYATAIAGGSGTPKYDLRIRIEYIGV